MIGETSHTLPTKEIVIEDLKLALEDKHIEPVAVLGVDIMNVDVDIG